MRRRLLAPVVLAALLGAPSSASAFELPLSLETIFSGDLPLSAKTMFSGRNVYSPVVRDVAGGKAMWYGGWQTAADLASGDKIYRRLSTDGGATWGPPTAVLTRELMPGGAAAWRHVNDPTITLTGRPKPYTMFFTACRKVCDAQRGNEIWSAESGDGVTWTGLKVLMGGYPHPAEPSAISEPSGRQSWKVYFTPRAECGHVRMVSVDTRREAITTPQTVYRTSRPGSCLLNPEVKRLDSAWHLFYERADPGANRRDVEESESRSNTAWTGFKTRIENDGRTFCATIGPGIEPLAGARYNMYFGLTRRRSDGTCDVSHQRSIERWSWRKG